MVGNSVSWALYFLWYANIKAVLARRHGEGGALTSLDYFAASAFAGVSTSALTNPIWVIKTRMLASGRDSPGAYKSMIDGARSIWRQEGARGFWHGLVPSLFGISHGAVQFVVYEQLKNRRARTLGSTAQDGSDNAQRLSNWDYLFLSGVSKAFAAGATYPFQVVRARLQTYRGHNAYLGFSDAIKQIWTNEGARGYYRG
jgi:solute carrier family 25 folate transporter 32